MLLFRCKNIIMCFVRKCFILLENVLGCFFGVHMLWCFGVNMLECFLLESVLCCFGVIMLHVNAASLSRHLSVVALV